MAKPKDEDRDEIEDALADFTNQIAKVLGPDDAAAHFEMAVAYEEMGLHEEALAELEIVVRAGGLGDEAAGKLYLQRAITREAAGDLGGALLDFERVRAVQPDHEKANEGYARLAKLVLLA